MDKDPRSLTAESSPEDLATNGPTFAALANSIAQFAWIADASGSIHWYNQRWYDYTGTTLEQMRGWGWRVCHPPDHLDRVVDRISRPVEDFRRYGTTRKCDSQSRNQRERRYAKRRQAGY